MKTSRQASPGRPKNRRGEGSRLRGEIIRGAAALLERSGSREAITLRAVAREVGISAPSIYAHFETLDEIIDAVLAETFERLRQAITAASDEHTDPYGRLLAGCRAYVQFGLDHPAPYRVLFARQRAGSHDAAEGAPERRPVGLDTFQVLVDSIAETAGAGASDSTDPQGDAANLWTALHGLVTLRSDLRRFPWPPLDAQLDTIVRHLARVHEPRSL
jgi:AcrR family transcriptional regulator